MNIIMQMFVLVKTIHYALSFQIYNGWAHIDQFDYIL